MYRFSTAVSTTRLESEKEKPIGGQIGAAGQRK